MSDRREFAMMINLGYRAIAVTRVPFDEMPEGEVGNYLHHAEKITLAAGLPEREEFRVLLHELLHAIWAARGVVEGDDEERIVGALGEGLAEALLRNPALVARIVEVTGAG